MTNGTDRDNRDIERFAAGIRRQIGTLEERAGNDDPWVAAEMLRLSAELHEAGLRAIGALRASGYRWEDIGYEFGISGRAAMKRFGRHVNGDSRPPG